MVITIVTTTVNNGYYLTLLYLNEPEVSGKGMFIRFQHMPRHGVLFQPLNTLRRWITSTDARCVWCTQLITFFSPLARYLRYESILSTKHVSHILRYFVARVHFNILRILHPFIINLTFTLLSMGHDIYVFVKLVLHKFRETIMRAICIIVSY